MQFNLFLFFIQWNGPFYRGIKPLKNGGHHYNIAQQSQIISNPTGPIKFQVAQRNQNLSQLASLHESMKHVEREFSLPMVYITSKLIAKLLTRF